MMSNIAPNTHAPAGPLVAVLVYDGLCTFEFAIAAEIFALPRPEMGPDWYRFALCPVSDGPMRALGGLTVTAPDASADGLERADLIIIPGWPSRGAPGELIAALNAAHARGARLASICSGAFLLAAAGLLNGKRAATHWRYAQALQDAYPGIEVDARVLYAEADRIYTSAGSAAGIDLMLHIIRQDFGAEAANTVARRLVIPAHRNGGQAQFIERPVPARPGGRLAPLMDAVRQAPDRPWTQAEMAREASMSLRTFARRFRDLTGEAPGQWVTGVRVEAALTLLETTRLPMEDVARQAGFGSAALMRVHLRRRAGLSPGEHRQRFMRSGTDRAAAP